MVLIKLSAHHKIAGIEMAMLLVVLCLVFATGAASNNADSASNKPDSKAETSVTQSYDPETQDECIKTTESTISTSTTASETKEATDVTEVVEETTVVVETTEIADDEPVEEDLYIQHYTEHDAIDIAKVLYHECRGVPSKTEQACVAWTILNRVDNFDSTVYSVVRSPNQFAFYEGAPVWDDLLNLAYDVLGRWSYEKNGGVNVGRVLPKEYIYFEGYNGHNYFRDNYSGSYNIWDYSLESPYKS